jgi:hypothetical protein
MRAQASVSGLAHQMRHDSSTFELGHRGMVLSLDVLIHCHIVLSHSTDSVEVLTLVRCDRALSTLSSYLTSGHQLIACHHIGRDAHLPLHWYAVETLWLCRKESPEVALITESYVPIYCGDRIMYLGRIPCFGNDHWSRTYITHGCGEEMRVHENHLALRLSAKKR